MMGSGKSVVGNKFAKNIGFKFIDTDSLITKKTGKSINQIFKNYGENHFRRLEEKIIGDILNKKNYVFSLGGGTMLNENLKNT